MSTLFWQLTLFSTESRDAHFYFEAAFYKSLVPSGSFFTSFALHVKPTDAFRRCLVNIFSIAPISLLGSCLLITSFGIPWTVDSPYPTQHGSISSCLLEATSLDAGKSNSWCCSNLEYLFILIHTYHIIILDHKS